MAEPARLVAEAIGEGFLKIGFKQGDEWMRTANVEASITLHYPQQGEMMRLPEDPSETEYKAKRVNDLLYQVNVQLDSWCS